MFRITQRYLASNFIIPFMASVIFFVSFLLTFQLFRITRIVINKGVDFTVVLELMGHIAVSFIPIAIPISALFATIFTMNKLSEDSEIIAMRSFGMRKIQLFTPLLILGVVIALITYSLNRNLIPRSKRVFKNTVILLTSNGLMADIKAGDFFIDVPKVTLFAEKVEEGGKEMESVFIHVRNKDGNSERVIVAKEGRLQKANDDEMASGGVRLALRDGSITKTYSDSKDVEVVHFYEYDFPLLNENFQQAVVTKDSMRTNDELLKIINAPKEERLKFQSAGDFIKTQLEYWTRINTPLQTIIFILLGFTLGIKKGRGRNKNMSAYGLVILIGYYIILFTGISVARKGSLPPAVVVFTPTVIAAAIAARFYKNLDWHS